VIKDFQNWFKKQTDFKFVGSSILLVYEGIDNCKQSPKTDVRMVDFVRD